MAHNLPSRLTSFVGREREIAQVCALVQAERLVTLVGTPGVGKTRLGLQSAHAVHDAFPDGVWLVELAPLADPELVPHAVADVLGVREQPGRTLTATLAGYLRTRRLLLVLDNCEHLIQAAATLAESLLQSCPRLHVLATSREPLSIEGELAHRVPSLSVPAAAQEPAVSPSPTQRTAAQMPAGSPSPAHRERGLGGEGFSTVRLTDSEAVRLFAERARSASPSFALTDRTAPLVGQICARLDGIPLAIELASARVRALSVEQIAARLDDRFRLLTGGSRTALPRQQTLRGAVDWSYDLLSEPEQRLLRSLSVFAGGFTLEAAEHFGASETLVSLVDKSLIQVEEGTNGGEPRYRLLETFRQYGQEKLTEHDEFEDARNRHRDYFLAFVEEVAVRLNERPDGVILDRLERDHDNLRTALGWCLEQAGAPDDATLADPPSDAEIALRLAANIWRFWWLRGHISEARRWLACALAAPLTDSSPAALAARATAFLGIANLSSYQSDFRAAVSYTTENLAFCRETGNDRGAITALHRLGYFLAHLGQPERSLQLCEESLVLARQFGEPSLLAAALFSSAQVTRMLGRPEQSVLFHEEAIPLFHELGNVNVVAYALRSLSHVYEDLGDSARGRALTEEGLRLSQQVGDKRGVAGSYKDLARFALFAGDAGGAIEPLRTAITVFFPVGDRWVISICLEILAGVLMLRVTREAGVAAAGPAQADAPDERLLDAVRLYAWAELLRAETGLDPAPELRGTPEQNVALLRERLGEAVFADAWIEGQTMSFEEMVEYALALTAPAESEISTAMWPGEVTPIRTTDVDGVGLTPREREVAALIVRGRMNREIAQALVLSERTVDSHVRNIMGKLEVNSRAQVAAWAVRHGIDAPR